MANVDANDGVGRAARMNDNGEDIIRRLALSRRTLYGWQRLGCPMGKPEDILRMIAQEIEVLEGIAAPTAELAESISFLIDRYRILQDRIRQKAN